MKSSRYQRETSKPARNSAVGYAADRWVPAASHFIVISFDFAIGGCGGKIQIAAKEPPPLIG